MNSADLARVAKPFLQKIKLIYNSPVTGENYLAKLGSKFPSLSTVKEYKKAIKSLKFDLEAAKIYMLI